MAARKPAAPTADKFRLAAEVLVNDFKSLRPIRAGSLVVSIFGDAIAPRGGVVWLGSLINAMEPFGINQRLVRTSVFRLAKDGWLESEQIGRRSYYRLTANGRQRIQDASRHIYSDRRRDWDEKWCLVMLNAVAGENRDNLRREFGWLGFANVAPTVMLNPAPDQDALADRLRNLAGGEQVIVMHGEMRNSPYLRDLVNQSFSMPELHASYEEFLQRFQPAQKALRAVRKPDLAAAFQVRTLLIHEYRRILLRDPLLPDALLPADFSGRPAYRLCRDIYTSLAAPADEFLSAQLESSEGRLPAVDNSFSRRFGGFDF